MGPYLQMAERIMNTTLRKGQDVDVAMDLMFECVDDLLLAGEFESVNRFLELLVRETRSVTLLLGALTITAAASEHLPARQGVYDHTRQVLVDEGKSDDEIHGYLQGLE